ncbi:MAG: PSD1 and planctomycete cytochrome C domain-containing protein [Planctomycetes bacterium]|nr:PSD1 and planctomycete cytochrome C domain-containing protein [Planctomycetota bacterium]
MKTPANGSLALPMVLVALVLACANQTARADVTFERDVLPIFNSHCLSCHGGLHQKAKLDLRTAASTLAGGKNRKVVVPGKPEASDLWQSVHTDEMPKNPLKMSAAQKEIIRKWIEDGAKSARVAWELKVPGQARAASELAKFIDAEIYQPLKRANIPVSPQAADGEFLRRVYLDVIGRIPTRAEAAAFLDATHPDKRQKLIDSLLARPEYGQYWARLWRDRVAVPIGASEDLKGQHTTNFHKWLSDEFNNNRPWNELVREMIVVEGDNPAVAFVRQCMDDGQPRAGKLASSVSRRFLGIRLECAECHDHPFTSWKQDDFWALAAFFIRTAKIEKSKTETRTGIYDSEKGPPKTRFGLQPLVRKQAGAVVIPEDAGPRAGKVVSAKFPTGEIVKLADKSPARPTLADWVTSPKNPMFARATVNRLWWHLFGRGLVNPVDALDTENPPSHPELFDALAGELVASKFDMKHMLRAMLLSEAYQRSYIAVSGNEKDETLYSHATGKVVAPEVLFESLVVASGNTIDSKSCSGQIGSGKSKGPLSSRLEFLKLFGTTPIDAEPGEYTQGIPQILALINDPDLHKPNKLVERAVQDGGKPEDIIERIFIGVLSRRPHADEVKLTSEFLGRRKTPLEGYQAIWWALLNSPEFAMVP